MRTIAFVFPGKMGDALWATPTVRALKTKYAPCIIDWVYDAKYTEFFKWLATTDVPVRQYIGIIDPIPRPDPNLYSTWRKISLYHWRRMFPAHDIIINATLPGPPRRFFHLADYIARLAGVSGTPVVERLECRESRLSRGYILVHAGCDDPARQAKVLTEIAWPPNTRALKYKDQPYPNVPDVAEPQTIEELVREVCGADLVVGSISLQAVMAAFLGKRTLCVHTHATWDSMAVSRVSDVSLDVFPEYTPQEIEAVVEQMIEQVRPAEIKV